MKSAAKKLYLLVTIFSLLTGMLLANGCVPPITRKVRFAVNEVKPGNGKLELGGVTISMSPIVATKLVQFPSDLVAQHPNNPNLLALAISSGSQPVRVEISNNTDHVIRLQGAVIRLFDTSGNEHEPLTKEEISSSPLAFNIASLPPEQAVQYSGLIPAVQAKRQSLKVIGLNTEILPKMTTRGWLIFPCQANVVNAGTFKVVLYDVVTATDAAGTATEKQRFEFYYDMKLIRETYQGEELMKRENIQSANIDEFK